MGLSSSLFLLFADDTPHVLASAAFTRRIRREHVARVSDFAGQRVRQACIVVELVIETPFACLRVCVFSRSVGSMSSVAGAMVVLCS